MLDHASVQAILHSIAGDLILREISRPKSGLSGSVYLLHTDTRTLVLRVFPETTAAWKPEKERIVYTLLRKQGVPVPQLLKTDLSRTLLPFAYVVSEQILGVPLWSDNLGKDAEAFYRQLGDSLGRIHSLTFSEFGDVAEREGSVTVGPAHELTIDEPGTLDAGPFSTWQEMHRQIVKRQLRFLQPTEFGDLVSSIDVWFQQHDDLLDYPITPRLLHMDLHGGNVLIHEGKITGVLDVEEALIGHNEFDLMRTELAHFRGGDPTLQEAFFEEYQRHIMLDAGYEQRKPFYELSRSLVWMRCLILYGDRESPDQASEGQAARTRIRELLEY